MDSTKSIAIVLLLIGAVSIMGGSLASEVVQSDRGALFTVSEHDTLVAADETGEIVRNPGRGNPAAVATLSNNFDEDLIIEYSLELESGSITLEPPDQADGALTLRAGETEDITARCMPPGESGDMGAGTADLVIAIDIAQGDTLSIEEMTTTVPVEYDCVGQGPPGGHDDDQGPPWLN